MTMKTYRNGLTSKDVDTPGGGPVITKQDGKRDADINFILKNFEKTGTITHLAKTEPQFGDFTQATEYDQALNLVRQTEAAFATWPAEARELARNDPGLALEMLADEGGRAALERIAGGPIQTPDKPENAPGEPLQPEAPSA